MSKTETVEQFLKRGGKVKVGKTPEYKSSGNSRYRMADLPRNEERVPRAFAAKKRGGRR